MKKNKRLLKSQKKYRKAWNRGLVDGMRNDINSLEQRIILLNWACRNVTNLGFEVDHLRRKAVDLENENNIIKRVSGEISRILDPIKELCFAYRQSGSTTALIDIANTRDCIIVVGKIHMERHIRKLLNGKYDVTIMTPVGLDNLLGKPKKPILFDNSLFVGI